MFALIGGQAQAVGQEGFDQDDHLAAGVGPLAGFAQGQGDVVAGAALAAAGAVEADIAGLCSIHDFCVRSLRRLRPAPRQSGSR
ncbi:hypothetical protein D9M73_276060 [compost metagenome]